MIDRDKKRCQQQLSKGREKYGEEGGAEGICHQLILSYLKHVPLSLSF